MTLEKVAGDPRGRGSGRKGGQGSGEQRRVTGKLLEVETFVPDFDFDAFVPGPCIIWVRE